jgi:NO-binding membrane sensor protein with MHYT domain
MAGNSIKQDDPNLGIALMHAFGFIAFLAALRLISSGTPTVGRLIVATVLMVPAYVLFFRDLRRMTLRSFGLMFFCLAFLLLLGGLGAIRNGHFRYSTRPATAGEICKSLVGGVICLLAGGYCFWRHLKQDK